MKRVILRTLLLATIIVLGAFAIARAQRGADAKVAPVADSDAASAEVNPLREPAAPPPARDANSAEPIRLGGYAISPPPAKPAKAPPTVEKIELLAKPLPPMAAGTPTMQARYPAPATQLAMVDLPEGEGTNPLRSAAPPPRTERPIRAASDEETAGREPVHKEPAAMMPALVGPREPGHFQADPAAAPTMRPYPSSVTRNDPPSIGEPQRYDTASSVAEGTGLPGGKPLEGPQSPHLTVQKVVPPEVQVGKPAVFRVTVRNAGAAPASGVEIHDQVPKGTRLLGTTPQASRSARGDLVWTLGTLKPGDESTVEMQLMPTAEGEVGSVASVHFTAEATARSVSTRPQLVIETSGANRVLVGDEAALTFNISNPGTGVATGVVLEEHIPASMTHPAGHELEYTIGNLKPGEHRKLELKLKATQAGPIMNLVSARGDANLRAEHRFALEVVAPKLEVAMNGPKRRYLEREATYQVSVLNPGTAAAKQVELVAFLPQGLRFVAANNAGRYDEATRAVYWKLEELPAAEKGTVELVTLPIESGEHSIKVRGTAQRGLAVEKEQPVTVEGLAAVQFQMSHTKDPVELNGETTFEVRVANQGSKAAGNVRVTLLLPPEMKPLSAEGPTQFVIDAGQVTFEPLAQLAPKGDATFHVRAQGLRAGDLRVRCQLMTDDMQGPVTKEESTRVYADE